MGPTVTGPVQEPLTVLSLNNRLYICGKYISRYAHQYNVSSIPFYCLFSYWSLKVVEVCFFSPTVRLRCWAVSSFCLQFENGLKSLERMKLDMFKSWLWVAQSIDMYCNKNYVQYKMLHWIIPVCNAITLKKLAYPPKSTC